jgi:aldose 1-epimerase
MTAGRSPVASRRDSAAAPDVVGEFEGQAVEAATIAAHGLAARVLSFGATLQGLWLDGRADSLLLGLDTLADYVAQPIYVGALVGRFANRIGGASAVIDGRTHRLDANWLGRHMLHGGADGSGRRVWHLAEWSPNALTLRDVLPDGHMGFPGRLEVTARFEIVAGPALDLTVEAVTDAPTWCGFAQHGYWALGGGTALDQTLRIAAARYLPVDADCIPAGPPLSVAGTAFDLRKGARLRQILPETGFDHNFCLSDNRLACRPVAWLSAGDGSLTLRIDSTEPGLQVFDGRATEAVAGWPAYAGIALEPQIWPDAPNRPDFPSALLRPGETYRQVTRFALLQGV